SAAHPGSSTAGPGAPKDTRSGKRTPKRAGIAGGIASRGWSRAALPAAVVGRCGAGPGSDRGPPAAVAVHELGERGDHVLVALAEQHGEDEFADAVPPQVVAAVATRESFCVQIHPVRLTAAPDLVASPADAADAEREGTLESAGVDPAGGADVPARVVGSPAFHGSVQLVAVLVLRSCDLLPQAALGFPHSRRCDRG